MDMQTYYKGDGTVRGEAAAKLPFNVVGSLDDAAGYRATPPVKAAVNVALNLGLPLLVTGEPGTGKSVLAKSVARELGLPLITFVAKSNTAAIDLLYRFDAVRHFRDAQIQAQRAPFYAPAILAAMQENRPLPPAVENDRLAPYIRFDALGRAIALTYAPDDAAIRTTWDDDANWTHGDTERRRKVRSVVLIDELDKAPRDVPNDLLVEIERREFRVAECGVRLSVQSSLDPIVIITSNSEKSLPDAFLRRCVFHHIEFPDRKGLASIVASRLTNLEAPQPLPRAGATTEAPQVTLKPLGDAAVAFLQWLRPDTDPSRTPLRKPPSVAELLSWLQLLLRSNMDTGIDLKSAVLRDKHVREYVESTLGVLIKDRGDRQRVLTGDLSLTDWAKTPSTR